MAVVILGGHKITEDSGLAMAVMILCGHKITEGRGLAMAVVILGGHKTTGQRAGNGSSDFRWAQDNRG